MHDDSFLARINPGARVRDVVSEGCENVRLASKVCELLGHPLELEHHLAHELEGIVGPHFHSQVMSEDPDDRPYLWDLET